MTLYLTDVSDSVLLRLNTGSLDKLAYTPFGSCFAVIAMPGSLAFNGELPSSPTSHYPLGNGYRSYNPVMMRFNTPDDQSPLGHGGLNPYAYCGGDPINQADSTGHISSFRSWVVRPLRSIQVSRKVAAFDPPTLLRLSTDKLKPEGLQKVLRVEPEYGNVFNDIDNKLFDQHTVLREFHDAPGSLQSKLNDFSANKLGIMANPSKESLFAANWRLKAGVQEEIRGMAVYARISSERGLSPWYSQARTQAIRDTLGKNIARMARGMDPFPMPTRWRVPGRSYVPIPW